MSGESPKDTGDLTRRATGYGLFMLTIVYAFNFIDRQILVILQEPIKQEMGLSDAQLGNRSVAPPPSASLFLPHLGSLRPRFGKILDVDDFW